MFFFSFCSFFIFFFFSLTFVTGDDVEVEKYQVKNDLEVLPVSVGGYTVLDEEGTDEETDEAKTAARLAALTSMVNEAGGAGDAAVSNGKLAEIVWESETVRSSMENVGLDPSSVRDWLENEMDGASTIESLMSMFGQADQSGSIPKAGKYTYLVVGRNGRQQVSF